MIYLFIYNFLNLSSTVYSNSITCYRQCSDCNVMRDVMIIRIFDLIPVLWEMQHPQCGNPPPWCFYQSSKVFGSNSLCAILHDYSMTLPCLGWSPSACPCSPPSWLWRTDAAAPAWWGLPAGAPLSLCHTPPRQTLMDGRHIRHISVHITVLSFTGTPALSGSLKH